MKLYVGFKKHIKLIYLLICIIYILVSLVTVIIPVISEYRENYTQENYLEFNEPVGYEQLFYNTLPVETYGIGSSSKYFCALMRSSPDDDPFKSYYTKKGVKVYTDEQIDEFISLIRQLKFKSVERKKAFYLSFLCNESRSITSISFDNTYISDTNLVENEAFSQDCLDAVLKEGFGIYECGFFKVKDKFYLVADIVTRNSWLDIYESEYPDVGEMSRAVFEVEPCAAIRELSDRRDEFYVSYFGYVACEIPWDKLLKEAIVFASVIILLVAVYLLLNRREKVLKEREFFKAELRKSMRGKKNRKRKKKRAKR